MTAPSPTLTLSEWLLERVAEDEAVARAAMTESASEWRWQDSAGRQTVMAHIARHDPARVLAECAAKRAILEIHANQGTCAVCVRFHADMDCENELWPCPTLRALAQPYRDHPGFDPRWTE